MADAEAAVGKAYTTKPVIEGVESLDDLIKAAYKKYSDMKIQLSKDKNDLKLQYNADYLYSIYATMLATKEKAEIAEREADPAAAKAAEDAINRAARAAEKKAALPNGEKLALLQELADASARADSDVAVPELLRREGKAVEKAVAAYKAALRDPAATAVQRIEAEAKSKKAQERYLALKEQVKMEEDKKAAALVLAKEAAQEAVDKRNAIALTPAEKKEIVAAVQKLTTFVATGDEIADAAAKEVALEAASGYQAEEKEKMVRLRRQAKDLKEANGEDDTRYIETNARYYKQKAIFKQVKKILKNTNSAGASAQAEVDKAKFGGELAGYLQDEIKE